MVLDSVLSSVLLSRYVYVYSDDQCTVMFSTKDIITMLVALVGQFRPFKMDGRWSLGSSLLLATFLNYTHNTVFWCLFQEVLSAVGNSMRHLLLVYVTL